MKKLTVILMFAAVFFLAGGSPSHAADFDVKAGVSKLSGDTTYRIGNPVEYVYFGQHEGYFPFSQLEFPRFQIHGRRALPYKPTLPMILEK